MSVAENSFEAAWLKERDEYFSGLTAEIKALRDEGVFKGKRIAILGCWQNAAAVKDVIESLDLKVDHIADNSPAKQGEIRLGLVAQSVESLRSIENIVVLALNNTYWRELRLQLAGLGLAEGNNFFVLFGGESFKIKSGFYAEQELLAPDSWREICENARSGWQAYNDILAEYPGLPIWLMHQPSIGDLYIFSLFLPHAMGKNKVSDCDCVLIVSKGSTKRLAEAIGYKNIVLVSFEQAHMELLSLARLMGDKLNLRNAVYHGLNNIFQSLVWNTEVSFRDSFTKYVFHFEDEVAPIFPELPGREDVVAGLFSALSLTPGQTVLISPYAGHFNPAITIEQWTKLVAGLVQKGYDVCTNCGGPNEPPLPGTKDARIDLRDSVLFAEKAGFFLGIRSGFCDIVCTAQCRKIVIYETGAPAASIDYFGFEKMDIVHDIEELINDCINTDDLIERIIDSFPTLTTGKSGQ